MSIETGANLNFNSYQNANADVEAIKEGFLTREYEYHVIVQNMLRNSGPGSVQHYLLLGDRGSGKSTLLRRLQVEIDTNEELSANYIAVYLAEEQANIYRPFDLFEAIIRDLEHKGLTIEWPEEEKDEYIYSKKLLAVIYQIFESTKKRIVLLLDNIDRIFEVLGEETALLRAHLQNLGGIKIIGGLTKLTEPFWSYRAPFYDFFRVLDLEPLDNKEVKSFLLGWGEKLQAPQLKEFVEDRASQLETIRVLTDALPRTLHFFVNILLTHGQETGYDYLRLLMDKVTPLYQGELNNLPPAQRKIVLQMALAWESVGAKELALATRMENRVISAQLSQLIDKKVAEKIATKTKNHLYRLSDRFFTLWLIFTQGSPKEKRRARYLSAFLENFYEDKELKAFSQAKYIPSSTRNALVKETEQLQRTDDGDGIKEFLKGLIHRDKEDFASAEQCFLASIKHGFLSSVNQLAILYERSGRIDEAEKYYLFALKKQIPKAAYWLSGFYYSYNKNKGESLSILKAAAKNHRDEDIQALLPILKMWNGEFNSLKEDVYQLVREKNPHLTAALEHLLVHSQVSFVQKLFAEEEFGAQLMEEYLPLYYATPLFRPDANEYAIRIPPEIKGTVNELILAIYRLQDFYYNTKEAVAYKSRNVLDIAQGSVATDAK